MNDLHEIFAKNVAQLRAERRMTQAQLAAALNYSDKAVSKWERGEALPDVTVVKQIADIFGVTVDYLLKSDHTGDPLPVRQTDRRVKRNRLLISAIATVFFWLIATFLFFVFNTLPKAQLPFPSWMFFLYALIPGLIVLLVFNSIWGRPHHNFLIISVLVWALLAIVYLTILLVSASDINLWQIFLLGIPAQLIIMLWSGLKTPQSAAVFQRGKNENKKEIKNATTDAAPPSPME